MTICPAVSGLRLSSGVQVVETSFAVDIRAAISPIAATKSSTSVHSLRICPQSMASTAQKQSGVACMRTLIAMLLLCLFAMPAEATPQSVSSALAQVASRCSGFQTLSTFRRGAVIAGTRRASLHRYGLAVDFRVNNYSCAYAVLSGWNHGLSMDAWRMRHIHISDGGAVGRQEGRFFHGGGRHYASRHRSRHHRRYARS